MEKTFDKFFDELAENTLGRSKLKEINDDAKSTYLYTELENGKLASRSKILQDHMHTHPMGYITGTRLDLILETENFLEKLDANSSLRKPTAKLLSYCKMTTKIIASHDDC